MKPLNKVERGFWELGSHRRHRGSAKEAEVRRTCGSRMEE